MSNNAPGPRSRALYLAAVAVGVFVLPDWRWVAAAVGLQLGLWIGLQLGAATLWRQLRKLSLFLAVILVAYSLVSTGGSDDWRELVIGSWVIEVNATGAMEGLTMVLRVLAVVLASQVVRAGDPRALASGMRGLGMPRMAALSIDATLSLLGGGGEGEGGRGRGRGGKGEGGGKGMGKGSGGGKSASGFWQGLKRLARGDVSVLADRLRAHVARVERHVAETDAAHDPAMARDVAIIAGIALTMLGIKALKLLPGLPFAPGHKGVLLIPLYIVAGRMTRSRFGATMTGLTMGMAAFLMGDGRWGVFEIAKHVAPGILVDLFAPLLGRRGRGVVAWSCLGLIVALGRFATVTLIALSVQAPAVVYAFLLPGLAIHATFGVLSGIVTAPLVRALDTQTENDATVSQAADPPRGREEKRT